MIGVRAGRVLSSEIALGVGCRRSGDVRKATSGPSLARDGLGPCGVGDPEHARKHLVQNLGDPRFAREDGLAGRIGKSIDVRR